MHGLSIGYMLSCIVHKCKVCEFIARRNITLSLALFCTLLYTDQNSKPHNKFPILYSAKLQRG